MRQKKKLTVRSWLMARTSPALQVVGVMVLACLFIFLTTNLLHEVAAHGPKAVFDRIVSVPGEIIYLVDHVFQGTYNDG